LHGVSSSADGAAVTIVLAAADYPSSGDRGTPIDGVAEATHAGAHVFHAGTALEGGRLVTNGGRVLDVTGVGATLGEARRTAYEAAGAISCPALRFRRDVAAESVPARA
jgi:phosphoribosylamine---glycine ligase